MERNINSNKHSYNKKSDVFRKILVLFGVFLVLGLVLPMKLFVFVPLIILHVLLSWARNIHSFGWLGVELIMFNTVIAGILLGWLGGVVVAVLCVAVNYVFSRKYTSFFIITLPLYVLIGFLSSFFSASNIVATGIIFSLSYSIISFFLSFSFGARPLGLFVFTFTNVLFNVLLFSRLGSVLIGVFGA